MNQPLFQRIGQNQFKLNESVVVPKTSSPLQEACEKDLKFLEEQLISEGFFDKLKQTVGGAVDKAGNKAKELLVRPLIKVIIDKAKKDDPQGFAKLKQLADGGGIGKIMNAPAVKQKSAEIGKQLQTIQENMSIDEMDDFLQEYMDAVMEEARVLKDDPRNVRRRELAAQRRAARNKEADPKKKTPVPKKTPKPEPKKTPAPKPAPNKTPAPAPKPAPNKTPAPAPKPAPDKTPAPDKKEEPPKEDPSMLQKMKAGVGGIISKVYSWVKANPKLTAGIALALVAAIVTAVAMNSGSGENMVQSELEKSPAPEQPAAQNALQDFNTISNAEMAKVAPDANKILDVLQNPQNGAKYGLEHWKEAAHMFDPSGNPSAGWNASRNIGFDYNINGNSLHSIIDAALPDSANVGGYLYKIQTLAQTNPAEASKLLTAQIAKGLKVLASQK